MSKRPQLNIDTSKSKPVEGFLHETLRPILKQKNERLLACLAISFSEKKINVGILSDKELESLIEQSIQKDIALKNILLGITVGAFSDDEFKFYCANKKELNKRIFSLIKERFLSQLVFIKANYRLN